MAEVSDRMALTRRAVMRAHRRAGASRRMLPAFLIIGAQKAGTTSLHRWLCEHPDVGAPATKEIHYFDLAYHRGSAWYRAHFPQYTNGARITGEATPYYLFHPAVPGRVAEELPGVRVIVLLRDPVDRAISHHNHERALGFESLPLREAIAAESARLAGAEHLLAVDPRARSHAHQHHSYVARGRYTEQLRRWERHVPRERTLTLFSEDLFRDPAGALVRVQEFLELPAHVPRDLTARNARDYRDAPEAVRTMLQEMLGGETERLAHHLGRRPPWPGAGA